MVAVGIGGGERLAEWAWKVLQDCSLTKDKSVEHIRDTVQLEDIFMVLKLGVPWTSPQAYLRSSMKRVLTHFMLIQCNRRHVRSWAETMLRRSGTARGTSSSRHGHRRDSVAHTSI
uniref:Uncharacterized protein n=1 Tax=Aegilops tauschii subsp. strangulata TaxID=200361 RepID=A0A453LNU5_AEGTS